MISRRTCAADMGWWLVAVVFCAVVAQPTVGAPLLDKQPALDKQVSPDGLVLSTEALPATTEGGDEEMTADGHYRDDVVPLETVEERAKFLTTLLMLENFQDGHGIKTAHPERLASDEEVMSELFKIYQNTKAYHGKQYLKIPSKLMKKMRRKMKELMME